MRRTHGGDLTDSSMGRTHYGIVRTDSSMAIHSLTYGGAARNFPSLPIQISAMTVLQYYSCVIGGIEITSLSIQYGSPRR